MVAPCAEISCVVDGMRPSGLEAPGRRLTLAWCQTSTGR